jgi:uncharacterized protein YxeA
MLLLVVVVVLVAVAVLVAAAATMLSNKISLHFSHFLRIRNNYTFNISF